MLNTFSNSKFDTHQNPLRYKHSTLLTKSVQNFESWVYAGFNALVFHLSRLKIQDNSRFGLTVSQNSRMPFKTKVNTYAFSKYFLNIDLTFYQWKGLCFTLYYLGKRNAHIIPIVPSALKHLATAVSWSTWQGELTVWNIIAKNIKNDVFTHRTRAPKACYVILTTPNKETLALLSHVPSIGILSPFDNFTPWAGITTLNNDFLLQYFLLAWAWHFAK